MHIELATIPAGEVLLRDDRIAREWSIQLEAFYIGRVPVTQAQYEGMTVARPSMHPGPERPVESVSWLDAVRFCNSLSEASALQPCYKLGENRPGAVAVEHCHPF